MRSILASFIPRGSVVFWEHVVGMLVLLPLIILTLHHVRQVTRRQWAAITVVSFLSGALGTILYTAALGG